MITRIVKLTIQEDKVKEFKDIFTSSFKSISSFAGCTHLSLYHELNEPNILITFSNWNSNVDLENYRQSELFKSTWSKVKPLFSAPPITISMEKEYFNS